MSSFLLARAGRGSGAVPMGTNRRISRWGGLASQLQPEARRERPVSFPASERVIVRGVMAKTPAETLDDLAALLADFQGREYSEPIGRETRFFADLGFASIDAVVLGEALEGYYGQRLPFPKFLSMAAQRGAEDLKVGDLADFLAAHVDVKVDS